MTDIKIHPSWKAVLDDEFQKPYFTSLIQFVKNEYATHTVYPPGKHIFAAFDYTPFENVQVVILGQDPYHGAGQAHGLCFSVNDGIPLPPSLVNIYKEILSDIGTPIPKSGNLTRWAQQGVLLLNATLTVRANTPGSHQNQGWETFTDAVVQALNINKTNIVFILWGAYAQRKATFLDIGKHLILKAAHPSPFSAAKFLGCRHFSQANAYLAAQGKKPMIW
ncbi:MAG: uracil-DNA glycosylase [Cytophagales bacterium]|nr:uracil-DNA glycosylase [Cytophagales bacterium]